MTGCIPLVQISTNKSREYQMKTEVKWTLFQKNHPRKTKKEDTSSEIMDKKIMKISWDDKNKNKNFRSLKRGGRQTTSTKHPFVDLETLGFRRSNRSRRPSTKIIASSIMDPKNK